MSQNTQPRSSVSARGQTLTLPIFPIGEEHLSTRRLSASVSVRQQYPTITQLNLPYGEEYRSQARVPPAGADFQRQRVYNPVEDSPEPVIQRRLSVLSEAFYPVEDEERRPESTISETLIQTESDKRHRRTLFILEPMIAGLILLPIITLCWECGWNLVWTLLNIINGYPSSDGELHPYSLRSLLIPYFIVKILLLIFYFGQDFFYNFLKRKNHIARNFLLKCHIFLLTSIYIVQWEMLWVVWDQYTPRDWYFELVISLTSLFSLIVLIGHLSDLVCAPFLVSYDSIEYCIHFGCPLLIRQVSFFFILI
jgi:hypothetical protein